MRRTRAYRWNQMRARPPAPPHMATMTQFMAYNCVEEMRRPARNRTMRMPNAMPPVRPIMVMPPRRPTSKTPRANPKKKNTIMMAVRKLRQLP
jgi:hypothetical protein